MRHPQAATPSTRAQRTLRAQKRPGCGHVVHNRRARPVENFVEIPDRPVENLTPPVVPAVETPEPHGSSPPAAAVPVDGEPQELNSPLPCGTWPRGSYPQIPQRLLTLPSLKEMSGQTTRILLLRPSPARRRNAVGGGPHREPHRGGIATPPAGGYDAEGDRPVLLRSPGSTEEHQMLRQHSCRTAAPPPWLRLKGSNLS